MKALIISADNLRIQSCSSPTTAEGGRCRSGHGLPEPGTIKGKHGYEVAVDKTLYEVNPDEYTILVLPGGAAPAAVRKSRRH